MHTREQYLELTKDRLLDYIEMIHKNFWILQGNYVLELEKRYGDHVAMELGHIAFGKKLTSRA